MKNRTVLIFMYSSSEGELNVSLPIIKELIGRIESVDVYFYFQSKAVYYKVDQLYKEIMNDIGRKIIGTYHFSLFLYNIIDKNTIIISSDHGPKKENKFIKKLSSSCMSLLHLHSNAVLYNEEYKAKEVNNCFTVNKRLNPDFFLVGNRIDYLNEYYKNNHYMFRKEQLLFLGSLAYKEEWGNYLVDMSKENKDLNFILSKIKLFDKVFLVITRSVHHQYLSEENYNYQIKSIIELSKKFKKILFIIKPHPRENIEIYEDFSQNSNVLISSVNTYVLSNISDLVISFWSSAIQDCLSMKTPILEFHIHEEKNIRFLVKDKNILKSHWEGYGLCDGASSYNELVEYVSNEVYLNSFNRQYSNLNKIFIPTHKEETDVFNTLVNYYDKIRSKNRGGFLMKIKLIIICNYFFIIENFIFIFKYILKKLGLKNILVKIGKRFV